MAVIPDLRVGELVVRLFIAMGLYLLPVAIRALDVATSKVGLSRFLDEFGWKGVDDDSVVFSMGWVDGNSVNEHQRRLSGRCLALSILLLRLGLFTVILPIVDEAWSIWIVG